MVPKPETFLLFPRQMGLTVLFFFPSFLDNKVVDGILKGV